VGQLRTSANITQLLGYSIDLYRRLERETGLATGDGYDTDARLIGIAIPRERKGSRHSFEFGVAGVHNAGLRPLGRCEDVDVQSGAHQIILSGCVA
jgi:hypothetical protein